MYTTHENFRFRNLKTIRIYKKKWKRTEKNGQKQKQRISRTRVSPNEIFFYLNKNRFCIADQLYTYMWRVSIHVQLSPRSNSYMFLIEYKKKIEITVGKLSELLNYGDHEKILARAYFLYVFNTSCYCPKFFYIKFTHIHGYIIICNCICNTISKHCGFSSFYPIFYTQHFSEAEL